MATQAEVATISQVAAMLLAAPRDSAVVTLGIGSVEEAVRMAIRLYDLVGHERDSAMGRGAQR